VIISYYHNFVNILVVCVWSIMRHHSFSLMYILPDMRVHHRLLTNLTADQYSCLPNTKRSPIAPASNRIDGGTGNNSNSVIWVALNRCDNDINIIGTPIFIYAVTISEERLFLVHMRHYCSFDCFQLCGSK
jgi:hypothetical protein